MNRLADIYVADGSLHIWGSNADYSDCIKLRTTADWLELLRDLVTAGNAHFGATARLIEISGELNVAQFLSDDDLASSPDAAANPGTVYEVTGDAPYTLTIDDVRIPHGDYPPINFDDHSHRNIVDELSPLHWFGRENDGAQIRQDYTWQDFRREHLAQFEAMLAALPTKTGYTWAEFQAANQQALDDIAAFVGGTR